MAFQFRITNIKTDKTRVEVYLRYFDDRSSFSEERIFVFDRGEIPSKAPLVVEVSQKKIDYDLTRVVI